MRSSLILLLLLWSAANLSGQDQELMDSLRTDLEVHAVGDSLRFNTLSQLWLATLNNDIQTSVGYGRQILREAKTTKNDEWTAVGYRVLGINLDYLGEGDSALYYYALARPYYQQTNNLLQSGVLLFNTAIIHQVAGRYDSAKHYLILADSCFANPKYLRQRSAVNKLTATIVREQGDDAGAVEYATTAVELAREAGDSARMADAEQEIAFAYQALNDYGTSAEYFLRCLKFYERTHDDYFATVSLVNLATCYQAIGDFENALQYGERGLTYIESSGIGELEIDIRNVLGNVYWSIEDYTRAEDQFVRAEELLRKDEDRRLRGEILTYLSGTQLNLNKLVEARRNGLEAIEIATEQGRLELAHKGYGQLAIISRKRGDYEKAYDYMVLRQGFQDSLYRKEQSDKLAELTLLFEKEKKDRLISEQQNQLALLESQAKVDRLQKTALGVGLAALLFLLTAGGYSYQQRSKRQQLEKDQLAAKVKNQQKELSTHALQMAQKGQLLDQLGEELQQIRGERPDDRKKLDGMLRELNSEERIDTDWANFRSYFQGVHGDFEERLKLAANTSLSPRELRLAALIKMQLNNQEVGSILSVTQDSLYKAKYRLRKKLPAAGEGELDEYIRSL